LVNKDLDTEYVIPNAFPQQQWLQERTSLLRYTYIACLVKFLLHVLPLSRLLACIS